MLGASLHTCGAIQVHNEAVHVNGKLRFYFMILQTKSTSKNLPLSLSASQKHSSLLVRHEIDLFHQIRRSGSLWFQFQIIILKDICKHNFDLCCGEETTLL